MMNHESNIHPATKTQHVKSKLMPERVGLASILFLVSATVFAICIMLQVFFAGLATFSSEMSWARHASFINYFGFLPLVMVACSAIGKYSRKITVQCIALFGLVLLLYMTAHMTNVVPILGALHPVVALILFWQSISVLQRVKQTLYR